MTFDELARHYGPQVAQRLRHELTEAEFNQVSLDTLSLWLETRAEHAHKTYCNLLNQPQLDKNVNMTGLACRRWREAEDLAYVVAIADDVSHAVKSLVG